jgi:hypothetical protein
MATHTFARGERLSDVARAYRTTTDAIVAANPGKPVRHVVGLGTVFADIVEGETINVLGAFVAPSFGTRASTCPPGYGSTKGLIYGDCYPNLPDPHAVYFVMYVIGATTPIKIGVGAFSPSAYQASSGGSGVENLLFRAAGIEGYGWHRLPATGLFVDHLLIGEVITGLPAGRALKLIKRTDGTRTLVLVPSSAASAA